MNSSPPRLRVSLVVPVLNEEANIPRLYERVCQVMDELPEPATWELLFTDNHSSDRTFELLTELAAKDARVRVLRFSRNFGYQRSILTGYLNAAGDAVIQLDCDMQDPPELIPAMLADWQRGWKVVYGVRRTRKEGATITLARKIFYRVLNWLSDEPLPLDAGDFRLVDRCIIEQLRQIEDATPYLRGMIATMGFSQKGFLYDRSARDAGETKFRLRDLVKIALDGLLNHSSIPLRLASYASAAMMLLATLLSGCYLVWRMSTAGQGWPPGFATLAILLLVSTAMNAFFFGLQGEYIHRIFKQVKRQPLTIIEQELNPFEAPLAFPPTRKLRAG